MQSIDMASRTWSTCSRCRTKLVGIYHFVWDDAFCGPCARESCGMCSACGDLTFRDATGSRKGPDGRNWCRLCATPLVGDDIDAASALTQFRTVLLSSGLKIGVSKLAVDLVPLSRSDHGTSSSVVGLTHSSHDGRSWNHRVKISKHVPDYLFGAVMAHELGHIWIAQSEFDRAPSREQQEGMCELFAHLWLNAWGAHRQTRRWAQQLNVRADEYGRGYRWAVKTFGIADGASVQSEIRRYFGTKNGLTL